jgi:hypothetical protein
VSTGTWVISYRRILRVKPSNGMSRSGSPSAGEYTEEEVENARLLLELKKKQAEDNTERMQSSAHATEQQLMSVDAVVELIRRLVPSGASPARYASDTMTTGEPTPGNFLCNARSDARVEGVQWQRRVFRSKELASGYKGDG